MNGEDCAKRHEERRGLRQETRGKERIAPRDTRIGEDCANRNEERRGTRQESGEGSRQEAQGTKTGMWRHEEGEREGTVL